MYIIDVYNAYIYPGDNKVKGNKPSYYHIKKKIVFRCTVITFHFLVGAQTHLGGGVL